MFSFFKKKTSASPPEPALPAAASLAPAAPERTWREKLGFGAPRPAPELLGAPERVAPVAVPEDAPLPDAFETAPAGAPSPERKTWLDKLKSGLRKTGS